jgi:hypothetical protein
VFSSSVWQVHGMIQTVQQQTFLEHYTSLNSTTKLIASIIKTKYSIAKFNLVAGKFVLCTLVLVHIVQYVKNSANGK